MRSAKASIFYIFRQPLFLVILAAILCLSISVSGQETPPFFQLQQHFSKDGKKKISVYFVSLKGQDLKLVKSDGSPIKTELNRFSKESQIWFKKAEKDRKQYIDQIKSFDSKIKSLESRSVTRRNSFYKMLPRNANIAWRAEKQLVRIVVDKKESEKERIRAFIAFVTYSRVNESNASTISNVFKNRQKLGLFEPLEKSVEFYLPALGRFGENFSESIIQSAYTGIFRLELVGDPLKRPAILPTNNGEKNKIRALATLAIGKLNPPSKPNAIVLGMLLDASLKKINGQVDSLTMQSALVAIAENQDAFPDFFKKLTRHEKYFPDEVAACKASFKTFAERRKAQQQIKKQNASPVFANRVILNKDKKELLFGRFLRVVDDHAMYISTENQTLSIPMDSLSADERKLIAQILKKDAAKK